MAENDDSSLIGYDPLAWLQKAPGESPDRPGANQAEPDGGSSELTVPDTDNTSVSIPDVNDTPSLPVEIDVQALEGGALVLDSILSIQNVAALHQRLQKMLNEFDAIDIDASAVTVIDTSTLQLLLILKQTALKEQKTVTIDFPSERFVEAASLLGLAEMLEVDQTASGFF